MAMSVNGRNLLNHLKENVGKDVTAQDLAEVLGVKLASITGSFNAMVKKGLAVREDAEIQLEDGKHKAVKFLRLTEAGIAFDPSAEDAEK